MSTDPNETSPYELLGVALEATEPEIRTAYRQRSLKVHPDRNRGNPDAARKFHELNQAYELLLDPLRRMAVDAKLRLKEARKARFSSYDAKRKGLVEELEARERAFKKAKVEKEEEEKARWRENERIMEEGKKLREEREKELRRKEMEREEAAKATVRDNEPPTLGALDTTVRLKYPLSTHPSLTTPSSLNPLLSPFGSIDESAVVLSLKPLPPKKPKRVIALVPFRQIGSAFAAVCASRRAEAGLADIEVDWAEGKEPELIGWLKRMGKLDGSTSGKAEPKDSSKINPGTASASNFKPPQAPEKAEDVTPSSSTPFTTFPSTFPDVDTTTFPSATNSGMIASGLDYETLTLMRLRQAERARLEREIREREAAEGD
ncbi:hypothetical protein AcV7_003995 [Taiwanofungus camphoratus]|nr:hypothetical protein AcV7_003995 [Antrodia cinnamomea]